MPYPVRSQVPNHFSFAIVGLSIFRPHRLSSVSALVAHIPFNFYVGERLFTPGPYLIEPTRSPELFQIRPADSDALRAVVQAISIPRQNDGLSRKLLFYCRREHYFLAQVLVAEDEAPNPLPPSPSADLPLPRL